MNKIEIAATRFKFAKQLRKERTINLCNDITIDKLLRCAHDRSWASWAISQRTKLFAEVEKHGMRAYPTQAVFDGKTTCFQYRIYQGWECLVEDVEFKVKGRYSAKNFAEHFAYHIGHVYTYLLWLVSTYAKEEV